MKDYFYEIYELEKKHSEEKSERLNAMAQMLGTAVARLSQAYWDAKHTHEWNWQDRKQYAMLDVAKSLREINEIWKQHYTSDIVFGEVLEHGLEKKEDAAQ
jgi:hypothetical protein